MALSTQAFNALVSALGYRKELAQEMANAMFVPAPLSAALKSNIIISMANKADGLALIYNLEHVIQIPLNAKAARRLTDMFGRAPTPVPTNILASAVPLSPIDEILVKLVPAAVLPPGAKIATPTFLPVAGTYTGAQSVVVTSTTGGATFYYTTNGTTPTTGSTLYTGPIIVGASETLKVLAVEAGFTNSDVASAAYVINAGGPAAVNLHTAANYRILAESGISTTAGTAITGDIAVSPIAHTAITGFGLVLDGTGDFSTSALVTGHVFAADYAHATPAALTTAVGDMGTAYTDAAGRTSPDYVNLASGNLAGLSLTPGLYKFTTGVVIPGNVTLVGGASDVFIFQIAGTLDLSASQQVIFSGGLLPQNVFWQVAGAVTLHTSSVMRGIILAQTNIAVQTTATVHGRLLAQTAVTLDDDVISS